VWLGLSMAEREAITKQMARRYVKASKTEKGRMLDELCALIRLQLRRGHSPKSLPLLP
jgi:hypothetical protein